MTEQDFRDFLVALGQEFCGALAAVHGAEEIVPQDAYEVFRKAFDVSPDPQFLASLSEAQLEQLRTAFEDYLECREILVEQLRKAVTRTLARWPVDAKEFDWKAQR
jgi:hypothetical protein